MKTKYEPLADLRDLAGKQKKRDTVIGTLTVTLWMPVLFLIAQVLDYLARINFI